MELRARHGELRNLIPVSDKITNEELRKAKNESNERKGALRGKNSALRNRLKSVTRRSL